MPKTPTKPKPAPSRRPKLAPDPWLYSRKSAAALLGTSVDTIKALEHRGELTPIRLTSPRGLVHYTSEQLRALMQHGGAEERKPKAIT